MRLTTLIPILPFVALTACANTAKDDGRGSNDPDSFEPADPADGPTNAEPAPMNELDPEPAPAEEMDAEPADLDPEPAEPM